MKTDTLLYNQNKILADLSACLAQLTRLTLRQSLYDLHKKTFSYEDVLQIPALITHNAKKICLVDIYHVLTEDDGDICFMARPIGQFAENLFDLNRKDLQWLVGVNGITSPVILDNNYEINVLSSTATLLDLNPDHSEIVDGLAAAAEFQLIEASLKTRLKM